MTNKGLEDFIALALEEKSFEEVLEKFDLSPAEVFVTLYNLGLIDDEILESEFHSYE